MPKDTFINLPIEKQEKVMRSAINEFIKNGFEKANVGNIANIAGIAKGSIYQYFENKKELFLYSVKWSIDLLLNKFGKNLVLHDKEMDIFDFFYHTSKNSMEQIREEREITIFIQDVFLGKYDNLTNESMSYITNISEEYLLNIINVGKENGSVRKDIDDHLLILFITGVSFKIKEYLMNKARNQGEDIIDEDYEQYEKEINALIELLKHGMGGK
ncbi:TetR family transcriptional regulator [Mobilisporobacter senegalensis]|uniref:TetR family transcriptional regulator n=1 Tax=Mobilisporobacter senegalensis TaxID=1329262 RepID=A0A3N1XKQ4_9FIRM|nr:TetR/AcrR family transcriptional regulator [Mobilisporobacter senegalensis]ROR27293.1 TetR family transcriptional regulator [Mobilisporobacter senegalensis]